MEKIVIRIFPGKRAKIDLVEFPHLASSNRIVQKGINLLHEHLPRVLHFLSRQRAFSHFQSYPAVVIAPAGLDESAIRRILQRWISQKRIRRLFYVLIEVIFLPFALIAGFLPGPNIFFYSLFILLYFHAKAFFALGKVKLETYPLEIHHE